ncbi:hypothetical protein SLA2020_352240 [Shorea laevis]
MAEATKRYAVVTGSNKGIDFIKTKYGKLDILVNNAGIPGAIIDGDALAASGIGKVPIDTKFDWSKIGTETFELPEECLKTNYYGAKRMIDALLPLLQLSDSPRIVNVSSTIGQLKVSKATLNAYTRIVANKYSSFLANCVSLGFVKTDINHNTGFLTIDKSAESAVRLVLLPNDSPFGLFFHRSEVSMFD